MTATRPFVTFGPRFDLSKSVGRYRRVAQLVERCLDTAEVWGSSPHAPTIFIELFRYFCPPFVVPTQLVKLDEDYKQTEGRLAMLYEEWEKATAQS